MADLDATPFGTVLEELENTRTPEQVGAWAAEYVRSREPQRRSMLASLLDPESATDEWAVPGA